MNRMKDLKFSVTGKIPVLSGVLLLICLNWMVPNAYSDPVSTGRTFYVDNNTGNDSNDGLTPQNAWKTLEQASRMNYLPGDELLLDAGSTFKGKLVLHGGGSDNNPVTVSSYNSENHGSRLPLIDAAGYLAAIQIENGKNFEISSLELTADAGEPKETEAARRRYGVLITSGIPGDYPNFRMKNLKIHHIFASENVKGDGQNPTSNMGYGFFIAMNNKDAKLRNILIEGCTIEMTGHTGIRIFGYGDNTGNYYIDGLKIINNTLTNIGGPGMVPGRCENVLVRGNVTDHTGSSVDQRMHARGSGIWPWTCRNVLIEKNRFMHARGKADSCGAHIDFNCKNVVVQYNLSLDNAGGFVEILGNDSNCCYRYNVSINDGFRIKGQNGAHQEGKVLWTSGYTGSGNKRSGPINSYIYNNTVYVKGDIRTCFSFTRTARGILIANNIFYIESSTADVSDDQDTRTDNPAQTIPNVIFTNNLYQKTGILPESLPIKDSSPITGDPGFRNAGGLDPADYFPVNKTIVRNKGVKIKKIPGDSIGLVIGLKVKTDYFGNPVTGKPDLGAIEL